MKRKGKPKAKTKLEVDEKRTKDCDSNERGSARPDFGDRPRVPPPPPPPPLISVSIADTPPSRRQSTSGSSLTSAGAAPGQRGQSGSSRASSSSRASHVVVVFDKETGESVSRIASDEDDDQFEDPDSRCGLQKRALSGIGLVEQRFEALVRHNNLRCFLLGSLLFSVMNIIFLMTVLLTSRTELAVERATNSSSPSAFEAPRRLHAAANCALLLLSNLVHVWSQTLVSLLILTASLLTVMGLKLYIELNGASSSSSGDLAQLQQQQRQQLSTAGPAIKWPLDCNLVARRHLSVHCLTRLAVALAGLILATPTALAHYYHIANQQHVTDTCAGEEVAQTVRPAPLVLACALAYMFPLLAGDLVATLRAQAAQKRIARALIYLIVILSFAYLSELFTAKETSPPPPPPPPPLPLGPEAANAGRKWTQAPLASAVAVAFIAGLLRQGLLNKLALRATFKRSNELIDAKVSLEQQRQQQETLLLSVLPAYVAEQVKRNMLKKMDCLNGQAEKERSSCGANGASASNAHEPVVHACGQSSHQATNHGSSAPLPSRGATPESSNLATAAGSQAATNAKSRSEARGGDGQTLADGGQPRATTDNGGADSQQPGRSAAQPPQAPPPPNQAQQMTLPPFSPAMSQIGCQQQARRGFNELYIRTYNNVSLLYGDIVGFTRLCTQLSSSQLVSVLNNLFSHFDYLAEQHRIMRIKILGDCYYGVSGIPEFAVMGAKSSPRHNKLPVSSGNVCSASQTAIARSKTSLSAPSSASSRNDNHAINCVNMGLDMIQYIKCLNVERAFRYQKGAGKASSGPEQQRQLSQGLPANFELNMRIGIHTGHIHSGVIGLKKWQFDVWSNDVSIAMHCESSGVAGRVQVTEATVAHLRNVFRLEPAPEKSTRDTYLADKDIRTYLICERQQQQQQEPTAAPSKAGGAPLRLAQPGPGNFAPVEMETMDEERIREATIGTIRQTLLSGSASGERSEGLSSFAQNDIRPLSLEFRDLSLERQYNTRFIPTLNYLAQLLVLLLSLPGLLQLANLNYLTGLQPKPLSFYESGGPNATSTRPNILSLETTNLRLADTAAKRSLFALNSLIVLALITTAILARPSRETLKAATGTRERELGRGGRQWASYSAGSSLKRKLGTQLKLAWPSSRPNCVSGGQPQLGPPITLSHIANHCSETPRAANAKVHSTYKSRLLACCGTLTAVFVGRLMHLQALLKSSLKPLTSLRQTASNPLTLGLVTGSFLCVISAQFYLLAREHCLAVRTALKLDASPEEQSVLKLEHGLKQLYQLTVLILLFALDLSPLLMSFKFRSILIGLVAGVQLVCLIVSSSTAITTMASLDRGAGASRPGEACSQHLRNAFNSGHQLTRWACWPDNESYPQTFAIRNSNRSLSSDPPSQACAWWWLWLWWPAQPSDALLLLALTFWSFAFARQLEGAQRCNFLWRNRLNVDHEELEYISGINKILLENILPSHVVQHYLEAPALPTGGCGGGLKSEKKFPFGVSRKRGSKENKRANSDGGKRDDGEAPTASAAAWPPSINDTELATSSDASPNAKQANADQLRVRMSVSYTMRALNGPQAGGLRYGESNCELYHEQHDSVAVMFASIPHFYEFYDESDISKQGLGCIALLNEIICDFDKLLLKNKFSRIEKIKTIGSTYMAAAGLRPSSSLPTTAPGQAQQRSQLNASGQSQVRSAGRNNSTISQLSQQYYSPAHSDAGLECAGTSGPDAGQHQRRVILSQQKMNLLCLVKFATSLMSILNEINKQSFQVFKLRVGVNSGPVIAGIIGAQRPFYDIWGDCVNIASRMESLGEVGRIQVEERTAKLLTECLSAETYTIEKRGPIDVKGKGGMVTYFVDKRQQQSDSGQTAGR